MEKISHRNRETPLFLDDYSSYLSSWTEALRGYSIPSSFVNEVKNQLTEMTIGNMEGTMILQSAPNAEMRHALMKKQNKYIPLKHHDQYGLRIDTNCFLCENVLQGIDASTNQEEVPNNVMEDLGYAFVLPNRYPHQIGHALLVQKNHDNLRLRCKRVEKDDELFYFPEKGKTRGGIVTSECLEKLIDYSDKNNLINTRNHTLDAMSIPEHEHFHIYPRVLKSYSLIKEVSKERIQIGKNTFRLVNTFFDTLCVDRNYDESNFIDTCQSVLESLERDNQVFTTFYSEGIFLITPRRNIESSPIITSSAASVHHCAKGNLEKIKKFVVPKGEFNWEKYLKTIM